MEKQGHHRTIHTTDKHERIARERMKGHKSFNAYILHCIEAEAQETDAEKIGRAVLEVFRLADGPRTTKPG